MNEKNKNIITRKHLTQIFEKYADEHFIYICAPGGYGKTVAVRQWLKSSAYANTIISIDEYDNNPGRFCEHFCAALLSCQRQNTALADIVLHPAFTSAPDEFAMKAVSLLSNRKRTVFVIDDLYLIQNENVLNILFMLLKRLPDKFQIILISRSDLPKGFSDLWLKGRLIRITAEQLRFNDEEIASLCKKRKCPVTAQQAAHIARITGGWAIGINALLLADAFSAESVVSDEIIDHLDDFILTHIWEHWDEESREFMLHTAVTRELHHDLCNLLAGVNNSNEILEKLLKIGAFISKTDDGVYRYHHLFQDFLRRMVDKRGKEFLNSLLNTEGGWHLSRHNIANAADIHYALECFIRSKNYDMIAKSLNMPKSEERNNNMMDRGISLRQTPEMREAAEKHPYLFMVLAWAAFASGKQKETVEYLDQYYARLNDIKTDTPDQIHFIIFMYILDFRVPLIKIAREAADWHVKRSAKTRTGSLTLNLPMLHRSIRDFSELAEDDIEKNISILKAAISNQLGGESILLMETLSAGLFYEQGHLETAYKHALTANAKIDKQTTMESKFSAMVILVYILDALKLKTDAERVIVSLSSAIKEDRSYYINRNFKAFSLRRKLLSDNTDKTKCAQLWLSEHKQALNEEVDMCRLYIIFTTCRAYFTYGDYNSAIVLLAKVLELSRAFNRTLDIIEALILLSIAYWKMKRNFQDGALRYLEEALSTAHKYNFSQIFINEAAELAPMMQRLQRRMEQKKEKNLSLINFTKTLNLKMPMNIIAEINTVDQRYTEKQKAVMKLLCQGKTYREMTGLLGITLPTLRSHISLIYKKLNVTDQKSAVLQITALRLCEKE